MFYQANDHTPNNNARNPHDPITRMNVVKMLLRETFPYQPQFRRPFQMHATVDAVNALTNVLSVKNHVKEISPTTFSGVANQLMHVSAAPESTQAVGIANGWAERRISFLLTVQAEYQSGGTFEYLIQGYTDHFGVMRGSQAVDHHMNFFVNNIVVTKTVYTQMAGPNGQHVQRAQTHVADNFHVLSNNGATEQYNDPNTTLLMRPSDLVTVMGVQDVFSQNTGPISVYDNRSHLGQQPKTSNRGNSLPTNYTSKIMHGYLTAHALGEMGQTDEWIYNNAGDRLREVDALTNPFLAMLAEHTSSGATTARFRYGDLLRLDPSIDQRKSVLFQNDAQSMGPIGAQAASWEGGTNHHRYAAALAHAIPALMMDTMIGEIDFICENLSTGRVMTTLAGALGFTDGAMDRFFHAFIARFEEEVIRDLTYDNNQSFYIAAHSALYGETDLTITVESQGTYRFVVPTFCDGLFAPVVTASGAHLKNSANQFESLFRQASDVFGTAQSGPKYNPLASAGQGKYI